MNQATLLQQLNVTLGELFGNHPNLYQRPLSKDHWQDLIKAGIMLPCIPPAYGGLLSTETTFRLLATTSYYALPLALRVMIIQLLFTSILVKHANQTTQQEIFPRLMAGEIGGIAITEPDHGSDALNLQTAYRLTGQGYRLSGIKHWQGLSAETEWFLIAARAMDSAGVVSGNVDFFLHEMSRGGMRMTERYHTPGLLMMQYGKNEIEVEIPHDRKLLFPPGKRNPLIMDVFNTARLAFPAMGLGFFTRMLKMANRYACSRHVNNQPLKNYDLVRFRLEHFQAWQTICTVLFNHSIENVNVYQTVASQTLLANIYKIIVSDMMHRAAHSLQQIYGGMGYRRFSFPEMALVDSRPFQILDGSNDILSIQISWLIIKQMKLLGINELPQFIKQFHLTKLADESWIDQLLDMRLEYTLPQRRLMQLGQLLARVVVLHCLRTAQSRNQLDEMELTCALNLIFSEMHCLRYELSLGSDAILPISR